MATREIPTVLRQGCWIALVTFLVGCESAVPDDDNRSTSEALSSGATRVTNVVPGVWPEGSGWRLTLETSIGQIDGDGPDVFSAVSGLAVGEDGTIYVLDRLSGELRSFSSAGQHLRTVGRTGQGPGEYDRPAGLLWASNDTLVVVDQGGQRYSLLHDMEHVRSVRRRMGGLVSTSFRGGIHGDRIYEFTGEPPRPGTVRSLLGSQFRPPDPDAARDSLVLPVFGPEAQRVPVPTGTGTQGIPFSPGMVYHLDRNGNMWYGHSFEFRILQATWEGEPVKEIVLDAPATPIAPEEMNARLAVIEAGPFGQRGGRIDSALLPTTKPYFTALYLDPDDNLWVSVPAPDNAVRFAIFAADGRFLGYVDPGDFTPQNRIEPVVRNNRLYLVGQNELGVDRLYIYRIDR